MAHRLSVPFPPLLLPSEDDESSPSDSSHSTPRSSFLYLDPSDTQDHFRLRPYSLVSFDSSFFSIMGKESPLVKSSSRNPSGADLRYPLVPINTVLDATQGSPKREGVIMSFLRKKKKSLHTPPPETGIDPFPVHFPHRNSPDDTSSQVQSTPFSLPPARSNPRDPSVEAFEELDRFAIRQGMKYHPYSRDDAPYMLSYDRVLLDNDRYTDILLRRLNENQTPSFHDFPRSPPRTILDLGCGAGGWAVDAALYWPSSQVIGFDLLNPTFLRGNTVPSNVRWRQGNFIKYKLPFPKNTFDLVRMANLSLCIPYDRWEHVLSEVRRVLTHGGRLELIDDYLHFPYTKRPPEPSETSHDIPGERPPSSAFDDDDDEVEVESAPDTEGPDDDDDFMSTKSRFSSYVDTEDFPSPPPQVSYDPVSEWHKNFSVHPKPSKIFDKIFDKVFGRYNQRRLHEFNLYLAPPPCQDSDGSSSGSSDDHDSPGPKNAGKDFVKWIPADYHKEKEKKHRTKGDRSSEESSPSLSTIPDMISAKAAGRLGIQASLTRSSSSRPHPTQSPGLILWPATFIPIAPMELEMHACKHLHSLIGSKGAINEYFQDIARERQLPFDQQMIDDLIWDYERFRRKRFNWPTALPDTHVGISMPVTTTPRSSTFRSSLEAPYQSSPLTATGSMGAPPDPLFAREKLDFVRSIKVYSATKNDDEIHVI
ncbi:hypothetical protein JVU11DRAFT_4751 [Chiua virens]|nr:hypothetical protein JVU11DRAFT_4751 [Chiua virens]